MPDTEIVAQSMCEVGVDSEWIGPEAIRTEIQRHLTWCTGQLAQTEGYIRALNEYSIAVLHEMLAWLDSNPPAGEWFEGELTMFVRTRVLKPVTKHPSRAKP